MRLRLTAKNGHSAAAPFATSLLLLALMGHAFFVSATHFHGVRGAEVAQSASSVGKRGGSKQTHPLNAHGECLLCRLQRNYISDIQHAAPTVGAPVAQAEVGADLPILPASAKHLLSPPGRAPPSA